MPEAQNSASQKVLQRQALPLEAPSSAFSKELDSSAAWGGGDPGQGSAANLASTPVSQPSNIQRQLECGKLHSAQAQKLVMRAGSLYGNKATRQMVQRTLANKSAQPHSQKEASQTVQRQFLGGGLNLNTSNLSFATNINLTPFTNIPATPALGNISITNFPTTPTLATPTNISVPNPPTNFTPLTNTPVGNDVTTNFQTSTDFNSNASLGFAEGINFTPISPGQIADPLPANPVIGFTPGLANPIANSTSGIPIGGAGTTLPTEVVNNGPVTIQGYDPGTVLSQLPSGASIRLIASGNDNGVQAQTRIVPVANGLPANAVGEVVGAGGKTKGFVTLRDIDGIPAGTVFSAKFPDRQIGSIRPGATNNPFKPIASPVSTTAPQNGGLLDGIVTDVSTPVGVKDGDEVATNPTPTPSPSSSPDKPKDGGSLWDKLGDVLKNVFGGGDKKPEEKPTPTNRSSEAEFYKGLAEAIKAAGANGKYPVEVIVSGKSIIVETNGSINLDAPIPAVPVTGGVSGGNTVDIQGRQVTIKPIINARPPSSSESTTAPTIKPPFGLNWQDSNANAVQKSIPNNVRATLNFAAGATIPNSVLQQGVQNGWIRLMNTVDARGVQKPTYVLRDGQQFILIRNGQVANIAPIGGIKLLPR